LLSNSSFLLLLSSFSPLFFSSSRSVEEAYI
jgi:hypothetical protein